MILFIIWSHLQTTSDYIHLLYTEYPQCSLENVVLIKEMQSLGLDVRPGRSGAVAGGDGEFSLNDLTI